MTEVHPTSSRLAERGKNALWIAVTAISGLLLPGAGYLVAAASLVPNWHRSRRLTVALFAIASVMLAGQLVGLAAATGSDLQIGTPEHASLAP